MRSFLSRRAIARLVREDRGMTTAEYAVGTVAVAGLGGLLIKILTGEEFRSLLWRILQFAFGWLFGGN